MDNTKNKSKLGLQIFRGSATYDIKNSEEILLDGQLFYSKKNNCLYIGDGTSRIVELPSIKLEKPNVGTFTEPSITLNLTPSSASGEIGSPWPAISNSVSTNTGKYPYGPDPTGVTFTGSPDYSPSNISGVFGDDSVTMTVTQSYTAGNYANTDRGTESTQRIEAGTATNSKTFIGTAQYRAFFGSSTSTDVDALLESLAEVKSNTAGFNTLLITSNPSTATLPIIAGGYLYLISPYEIDTTKIKDDNTGFEVKFEAITDKTFTNSYNKNYKVYVYRSLDTFNAGSVTLRLR